MELVPYSGPTFLDVLPDALLIGPEPAGARLLWENPGILPVKAGLLPTDAVERDGWVRQVDGAAGLDLLGADLLGAGEDCLRLVLDAQAHWAARTTDSTTQIVRIHCNLDSFIMTRLATTLYCSKAMVRCQTTKISKVGPAR